MYDTEENIPKQGGKTFFIYTEKKLTEVSQNAFYFPPLLPTKQVSTWNRTDNCWTTFLGRI